MVKTSGGVPEAVAEPTGVQRPPLERRTIIRPISQSMLRLKPVAKRNRFSESIKMVLHWMANRSGKPLPKVAYDFQSFELSEIGAQRVAAVALEQPKYWAGRLDDADKVIPQRTWVTEIGIAQDDEGDVLFGTRLICVTRGKDLPFTRSIPGLVWQVWRRGPSELDGRIVGVDPWVVGDEPAVVELLSLLEYPKRRAPVVVISLPEGSSDIGAAAIDARLIHKSTIGVAHVAVLTGPATFHLTDRVGRELSVFKSGVRIYVPSFQGWLDEPYRHPLSTRERISAQGAEAVQEWITSEALALSVRRSDREEVLPSFMSIRQVASDLAREAAQASGGPASETLEIAERYIEELRSELSQEKQVWESLLQQAESERDEALEQAQQERWGAAAMRARIRALEARLEETEDWSGADIPDDLNRFEEWCQAELPGAVEVLPRALKGVKKSEFEDPSLVYEALLLLRDCYVPMRREGGEKRKEAYSSRLRALNLEESATGDAWKENEQQYSTLHGGRRRVFDRHLKRGNSREPRFCFRLYFFWDEETECAIVGWLPSHLDNRIT